MGPADLKHIRELKERADAAGRRWLALYNEPDSLSDPVKRRAVLQARLGYQDIVAEYLFILHRFQEPK